jgi:SAM-dependent methyltransferase
MIPHQLPHAKRVLDYACGHGRHTLMLEQLGYQVLAVDKDEEALLSIKKSSKHSKPFLVDTRYEDLEQDEFALTGNERFVGVVVTNYLYRPHLEALIGMVAKGGLLIYETFAIGNDRYGKPSNPDFLLRENELIEVIMKHSLFQILAFENLTLEEPKPCVVQRICAMRTQEWATIL